MMQGRDLVHLLGRRLVLQELEPLGAQHDGPRRRREVLAHLEVRALDLRRHALVVADVVDQVLHPAHEALAARLVRLLQRGGIADQGIGRRDCARQDAAQEARTLALAPVGIAVDDTVDRVAEGEVALRSALVDRMLAPGRVGEPPILRGHLARRLSRHDLEPLAVHARGFARHRQRIHCGRRLDQAARREHADVLAATHDLRHVAVPVLGCRLALCHGHDLLVQGYFPSSIFAIWLRCTSSGPSARRSMRAVA